MTYLVLVGERSAGKDTLADYVSKEYDIPQIVFSQVLTDIGKELGIVYERDLVPEKLKETQQLVGILLREDPRYGNLYHTTRLLEKVKDNGSSYILNGMRHPDELDILNSELEDVVVIGVFADYDVRYERTLKKNLVHNREEFAVLEARATEAPIRGLLANADYKIRNDGSSAEFYKSIDSLMHEIFEKH